MPKKRLVFAVLFSLLSVPHIFSQNEGGADGVLSLQQIDLLIETTAYNEALKELSKYIAAHPNDFDRAQKRISRVMKLREQYNKGAEYLVDVIKNGDESKSEKLNKITELESSELDPTETVIDFTNLARRTVTMGEVLIKYNQIMREGVSLVRKEKYAEAAVKFEEGFAIKNEFSDVVFELETVDSDSDGQLVVYENDITVPVRRSVNNVRALVAGTLVSASMDSRISDCERAYAEYMQAVASRSIDAVSAALKKVNAAFGKYAELRNKIIDDAKVLESAEKLAEERNPLLLGTSYISFDQKFILGDESNPDTGIIGAFDAYFNRRVESMKSKTNEVVFDVLNAVLQNLPENKIYSLTQKIESEEKNVSTAKSYAAFALYLHDLYKLEKNLDGTTVGDNHSGYASSMGFVNEYIADLGLAYKSVIELAYEKSHPEKIDKTDLSDSTVKKNFGKLMQYEKIKSDSKKYLSLIDAELEFEKNYFDAKAAREKELAELMALSGGKLKIASQKRTTAGVQISDDPLDFRKQIAYFTSVNTQNLQEATAHAKGLWGYIAQVYSIRGNEAYIAFEKQCSDTEFLLYGEKRDDSQEVPDEFSAEFIKKYPIEAKASAEKLNSEIAKKKEELVGWREILSGGEEYRKTEEDYVLGTLSLDRTIHNFDSLFARNYTVISTAEPQIKNYENTLREAEEQYNLALAAFKKENFDNANAAVDAASEKYAAALDIEYSEKIRSMREVTLNDLAVKIQQAEYEKVLREVFALKDRAATYYYSSNFDAAENILVSAQTKWAKVSTDPDSEIEDLLNIVKTVKSMSYGRVLLQSDPHYPELSYSLDMAKQSFERGVKLKTEGNPEEAKKSFEIARTNIRNVQNVYPLNKETRLLDLKIDRELDPEGFPRKFENQYTAAKSEPKPSERLAALEDLYEINPKYPGLAQEIYNIKDSLGMFPKKTVQKEVKKSADSKIAEARRAFKAAGNDEAKLNNALKLANEAIAIDGTSKAAKELKLDIQLKIGATSTAILSQNDEKMYAEAARLFNQRRFSDSKQIMDRLLQEAAAKKSRKVIDLYNRLLKRL
ncbi:MAG: hypothetical protein IJ158_10570 [Treponema sp.]|nr:hypothetical protein [Treponema sp.]